MCTEHNCCVPWTQRCGEGGLSERTSALGDGSEYNGTVCSRGWCNGSSIQSIAVIKLELIVSIDNTRVRESGKLHTFNTYYIYYSMYI